MNSITILVTGVGSMVSSSVLSNFKHISERKIRIIGCDIKENVSSFELLDKYYKIPRYNDDNYINELLTIAIKEKVDIIIPLIDFELIKIRNHIEKFSNFKVMMLNTPYYDDVINKGKLYSMLEKKNILVPNYCVINSSEELEKTYKYLKNKCKQICIKPTISSGARGFMIIGDNGNYSYPVKSYQEIYKTFELNPFYEQVMMEYLPGKQYVIHLLANIGEVLIQVQVIVNKEINGNMIEGVTIYDERIADYCQKIVKELKLDGVFGFELKSDDKGNIKILEINPRIQGSMSICRIAGNNIPYLGIKKILGEPININNSETGIILMRNYYDNFKKNID